MKKFNGIKGFILGFVFCLVVCNFASPVLAAAGKTIQVISGVRIFVNESELRPTDANGNPVEVFIYNGTTYLPVRAVSEALNVPVQWDGASNSVFIGKHSSASAPVAYLSDLDYFNKDNNWYFGRMTKDNLGNEHAHSINMRDGFGNVTYKLNGQYSRLTASYYQIYDRRDYSYGATVIIYGDGRELWRGTVAPGMDPVAVDIDITGVLELTLEYPRGSGDFHSVADYTALGDVALWS